MEQISRCIYSRYKIQPTAAHISIAKEIISHFGSQGKLATAMGWTRTYVCGWASGRYHLNLDRAEKLQKFTDGKWTVLQIRPDLCDLEKYFNKSVDTN